MFRHLCVVVWDSMCICSWCVLNLAGEIKVMSMLYVVKCESGGP